MKNPTRNLKLPTLVSPIFWVAFANLAMAGGTSVPFKQIAAINIKDPVALKLAASSNLYVLSGSTETLTEFDINGNVVRSRSGIGHNPSGLDVDKAGNVFVAVTGRNQVWKFKPSTSSFEPDATFGKGGFVGDTDGSAGKGTNQFDVPFGIAMVFNSYSQQEDILVSDAGNNRIQGFSGNGKFGASLDALGMAGIIDYQFPTPRPEAGLNSPKGISCYDFGEYTYIVDAGNNRILVSDSWHFSAAKGKMGTAQGLFKNPVGIAVSVRGICVADTGNDRVQIFEPLKRRDGIMKGCLVCEPLIPRAMISTELGLNQPKAADWSDDPIKERLYIADTGNNRVILVDFPLDNPEAVWKAANDCLLVGNVRGALRYYSSRAKADARDYYGDMDRKDIIRQAKEEPQIIPVFIGRNSAEYRYDKKNPTGPVLFIKEHGVWKLEN